MYGENMVSFESNVPMMEGTFYNPETGESVTVRDNIISDNGEMIIITTDGRQIPGTRFQNFIKSDKPIAPQPKVDVVPINKNKLLEGLEGIEVLDDILQQPISNEIPAVLNQPAINIPRSTPTNLNLATIEKALSKASKPKITVDVNFKNFPSKEIDLLVNILEINKEEIINYYISSITLSSLRDEVAKKLSKVIEGQLVPEEKKKKK